VVAPEQEEIVVRLTRYAVLTVALVGSVAVSAASSAVAPKAVGHELALPGALVGSWGKAVTATTWSKHGISYEPAGHWAIRIGASGVTALVLPPAESTDPPLTTMRATVTGHTIVFGPTADGFCPGKATYRWSVTGDALKLTLVKDGCSARSVLLGVGGFTRG
jgi:hypothetical protein